jgi:phosphoribosylanthranilate isomerase
MKVKVCGITSIAQMHQLNELGVDYVGMIFFPGSKRYVRNHIKPNALKPESFRSKKVGVFVNADLEEIKNTIKEYSLDMVQLHGNETPAFCNEVQKHVPVIKAITISDDASAGLAEPYNSSYILFDTAGKGHGGTGTKFNWQILKSIQLHQPYFLSGGIAPGDAAAIASFNQQLTNKIFAVDINSRFETAPGMKDIKLVADFITQLQEHTQTTTSK